MPKSRKQLQEEFAAELYLQASFFKMKTTGHAKIDVKANEVARGHGIHATGVPLVEFPNADVVEKYIPQREKWSKMKISRSGKKGLQ